MLHPLQRRRPTVSVILADGALHAASDHPGSPRTASEPAGPDPAQRTEALRQLCRRLHAARRRAVVAIPEEAVHRARLLLPPHPRRGERNAVVRLHVRRRLPLPPSQWRYRLVSPGGGEWRGHRLVAVKEGALSAAREMVRSAGLRPVAAVAVGDARPYLPRGGEPPSGPALALAVLEAAAAGAPDLFRTRPAAAALESGRRALRWLGLAAALALGAAALRVHWDSHRPVPPAVPAAAPEIARPEPPEPVSGSDETDKPASAADPRRRAAARLRALPGWLDTVADARPDETRLTELHLNGQELRLNGRAPNPGAATAYLGALEGPLGPGRLLALEAADGAIAFQIGLTPPIDTLPAFAAGAAPFAASGPSSGSDPDPGRLAAALAQRMKEAGLALRTAEPGAAAGGTAPVVRVRGHGGYTAVHRFVNDLTEGAALYEPLRLRLTAVDGALQVLFEVRVWPDREEAP